MCSLATVDVESSVGTQERRQQWLPWPTDTELRPDPTGGRNALCFKKEDTSCPERSSRVMKLRDTTVSLFVSGT